ncbi:Oxygen sensor protein DosP [compost metagenome]
MKTIISLGESLGLEVIAEGVETEEQHQFLIDGGCRNFQGFLFSKPLFKDDFIEYFFGGLPSKKEKG